MNSIPPILCSLLLAAMVAAGISHHWSIQTYLVKQPNTQTITPVNSDRPSETLPEASAEQAPVVAASTKQEPQSTPSKDEFFNTLLVELRNLKNENRDLRTQMGETNRDVMKLAFRVDTHSESFRPLPEAEERNDTSFNFENDEFLGVLPPRANPVDNRDN